MKPDNPIGAVQMKRHALTHLRDKFFSSLIFHDRRRSMTRQRSNAKNDADAPILRHKEGSRMERREAGTSDSKQVSPSGWRSWETLDPAVEPRRIVAL